MHLSKMLLIAMSLVLSAVAAAQPSVAFHYGNRPPWDALSAFDRVVLEPDHVPEKRLAALSRSSEVFAYVSVGEVDPGRQWRSQLPVDWLLGDNTHWNSSVIDQSQAKWPEFFIEHVIKPLHDKGFRNYFLDTLDSYQLVAKTPEQRALQEDGLVRLIRLIKTRYPQSKLFFNRGFEILPRVHNLVSAVAAESLYAGWDPATQRYRPVKEADRKWLGDKLQRIQEEYKLPVTVIDYLPSSQRVEARQVAEKISKLGFTPWVTNANIDLLGIGSIEVMPRKVLMLYDEADDDTELMTNESSVLYGTMPLNYMGYGAKYLDARSALPEYPLRGRYAGIVIWLQKPLNSRHARNLTRWLSRQVSDGVPLLIIGEASFLFESPELTRQLGLQIQQPEGFPGRLKLTDHRQPVGFELTPLPERSAFFPLTLKKGEPLAVVEDENGKKQVAAAYTPWGGYVLDPFAVVTLPGDSGDRWVVEPFVMMQKALRLPPMPVPDLTTENGRRLLLIHMDGDGFANRAEFPGSPLAPEVLYEKVLKRFQVPTTISVIEGEVGPDGLYPELSPQMEKIARKIFAMPHVEIGSHSFSHPFKWGKLSKGVESDEGYNLPIPGYRFDLKREISGSIDYITRQLAPPGKPVTLFQWTGNCNPTDEALKLTQKAGVGNINGGDTVITRSNPSMTAVAPIGMYKGAFFQVFAPNQNENVYTHDWTGPFYGFRRVIETFKMTDKPRRLKPMNIYYHTYAASKPASLDALTSVYQWALEQDNTPIYTSRYVRMATEFNHITVARNVEGWQIRGLKDLRQLRIPSELGYPDIEHSSGIAGFNDHGSQRYIHAASDAVTLALRKQADNTPQLADANALLQGISPAGQRLSLAFATQAPLVVRMRNISNCRFQNGDGPVAAKRHAEKDGTILYRLSKHAPGSVKASCTR